MKSSLESVPVSQKKYLTIGEVAEMFQVSVETLRKWERDFPRVLKPMRTGKDTRLYDAKQQKNVAMIYHLLREEGLSIEGAQKRLTNKQSDEEIRQEVIAKLQNVRSQLVGIVEEIDKLQNHEDNNSMFITHTIRI